MDANTNWQLRSLYVVGFANSLGTITLLTLLPTYIDLLEPSGIVIGLFITGLTAAQAVAVIPFGWAGDRYDKRAILLGAMSICVLAYVLFAFVSTSMEFVSVRVVQGLGVVGVGLLSLSLVGELAQRGTRGNTIGKYNAWKLAAGMLGTIGAGAIFDWYGFGPVFGILVVLFVLALFSTWFVTEPDSSRVSFSYGTLALNKRILTIASFRTQYAFAVTLVRNWVPIFVGVSAVQGGLGLAALAVGIVIATERFTNMIFQPFTGRLSDYSGRAVFVVCGGGVYGVLALGFAYVAATGHTLGFGTSVPVLGELPGAFFVAVVLNAGLGIADAFREPASMALFADEGTAQGGVASSFGIRNLLWQPGTVIAPLIGGVLMTTIGIDAVFALAGAFAVSGALTMFGILVIRHGRSEAFQW